MEKNTNERGSNSAGVSNQSNSNASNKKDQSDKIYSLNSILYKLNRTESNIFGNFFVNFSEMFNEANDYQKYMKKNVSITNNESVEKKVSKNNFQSNSLKPGYFEKFHLETLFYIFYYLPRDALQNYAADELSRRKWKYHIDLALWFSSETSIDDKSTENLIYFNPNEWKICVYGYGPLNKNSFLAETEITKLVKIQGAQGGSNTQN